MPVIQIGASAAQMRKLKQGKTIQLSSAALSGQSVSLTVSDKTAKRIASCLRRNVGMRLSEYQMAGAGFNEDAAGDGFNLRKMAKYAQMGAKIATSVVPKEAMVAAVGSLPGGSTLGAAGVNALYASQGKGLFSKAMKVAKIGAKLVPKSVVQAGASYALQKAGVSSETAGMLAKTGTDIGYSAVQNAPTGSGVGKGSAAMREKMARLRSMRKGRGSGMIPIGSGMIPIGGAVRSTNPLILDSRSEIFDSNGGDFLKKRRA